MLIAVVPEYDTAPANDKVPTPDFVRLPVPTTLPPMIKFKALATLICPDVPGLSVNPRFVELSCVPDIIRVPPANTKFAASLDDAPRMLDTPPSPIELMDRTPPLSRVIPV
jgi:hypothetical protein